MNVQIVARHLKVSASLQQSIRQRCTEAFNFMEGLLEIQVVIEDMNGPDKHGIDKRCHVHVRGLHRFRLDVEQVADEISLAIDLTFMQLQARLKRIRDQAKQRMQRRSVELPDCHLGAMPARLLSC